MLANWNYDRQSWSYAIEHYQEAMKKGGGLPEIKAAAQRGLDEPYEPPAGRREQTEQKK